MLKEKLAFIKKIAASGHESAHKAADLLRTLEGVRLKCTVSGSFSSGKSTLIGAMLGQKFLPVRVVPTTAHAVQIRNGKPSVIVDYKSGLSETVRLPGSWKSDFTDGDDSAAATRSRQILGDLNEKQAVEKYILQLPVSFLGKNSDLIDTPGTNSVDSDHTKIASEAVADTDIAVYVLNAAQPFGKSDADALKLLKKAKQRFIILNKIDLVDEEEQSLEDLYETVREQLRSVAKLDDFFFYPVSAKCRLDGSDRKIGLVHSFDEFLEKLAFVISESEDSLLETKRLKMIEKIIGDPEEVWNRICNEKKQQKCDRKRQAREANAAVKRYSPLQKARIALSVLFMAGFLYLIVAAFLSMGTSRAKDHLLGPSGPAAVHRRILSSSSGRYMQIPGGAVHGLGIMDQFNALVQNRIAFKVFFRNHRLLLFLIIIVVPALFFSLRFSRRFFFMPSVFKRGLKLFLLLCVGAFVYFFVIADGIRLLPDLYLRGGLLFFCMVYGISFFGECTGLEKS